MLQRLIVLLLSYSILTLPQIAFTKEMGPGEFMVLCYHNVPVKANPNDSYGVSQNSFVEQMEYLRTHGYNPVSIGHILAAREGKKELPQSCFSFDNKIRELESWK